MKRGRKLLAATAGLAAVSYIYTGCEPKPEVTGNLMAQPEPISIPDATAPTMDAAEEVPRTPMVSGNLMAPMPPPVVDAGIKAVPTAMPKATDVVVPKPPPKHPVGNLMPPPPPPPPTPPKPTTKP